MPHFPLSVPKMLQANIWYWGWQGGGTKKRENIYRIQISYFQPFEAIHKNDNSATWGIEPILYSNYKWRFKKLWIAILYTWNLYNVVNKFYFNKRVCTLKKDNSFYNYYCLTSYLTPNCQDVYIHTCLCMKETWACSQILQVHFQTNDSPKQKSSGRMLKIGSWNHRDSLWTLLQTPRAINVSILTLCSLISNSEMTLVSISKYCVE